MTSTRTPWRCPNCHKQSPSTHKRAQVRVCPHCQALIDLKRDSVIHTQVGYFPTQSHLAVGQKYPLRISGKLERWYVLGIINYAEGESLWDEALLMNRTGDHIWVSVEDGEIYAHTKIENPKREGLLDHPDEIRGRATITYHNVEFSRDSEGEGYVRGMSGAFFDEVRLKDRICYWEGYDPDDEDALSVSWSANDLTNTVEWYEGQWVEPSSLRSGQAGTKPSRKRELGTQASSQGIVLIVIMLLVVGWLTSSSDGEVKFMKDVPGSSYLKSGGAIQYTTPPMLLKGGRAIDFHFIMPERLMPLRLSARIALAKLSSSSTQSSSGAQSALSTQSTQSAQGTIGPSIELISGESSELKEVSTAVIRRDKLKFPLINKGTVVKTRAQVPHDGVYAIVFRGISEREVIAPLPSMSPAMSTSAGSTSAGSTSAGSTSANSSVSMSVPGTPSDDELLTYIVTTGAYGTLYLKILAGLFFVLLLFRRLRLWLFSWLYAVFK